jgi:hypothetical protein
MNIGIFGDSFADPNPGQEGRESEAWVTVLNSFEGVTATSYGVSGISNWNVYEQFVQHQHLYDAVIFVYSSVSRIPVMPKGLDGYNFIRPDTIDHLDFIPDNDKDRIRNIVDVYWNHLQSDDFDLFMYQSVFDRVNSVCKSQNKKLVNVLPFEHYHRPDCVDVSDSYGDCWRGIMQVSSREAEQSSYDFSQFAFDYRDCHLTKVNNEVLARLLYNSISSTQPTVYDIDGDTAEQMYGFKFGPEYADSYFCKED